MMTIHRKLPWLVFMLVLGNLIIACSPSSTPVLPTEPQQQATPPPVLPSLESTLEPSATQPPQVTLQPTPIFTAGLECKVLQDLNLRKGPGTAYTPPILVVRENAVVIPLGYMAKGIPRGSWVMVLDPSTQQIGWVNAAQIYVSCNSDISTLPQVAVEPPPPPAPPSAESSNVEGACGDGGRLGKNGNIYDCAVVFSDGLPIQFIVIKDDQEIGRAEGVQNVVFQVKQGNKLVYTRTEANKDYCIFSGDDPCNLWLLEDYVYKWESGGTVVEAGDYEVSIDVSLPDEPDVVLHWDATVKIALQQ